MTSSIVTIDLGPICETVAQLFFHCLSPLTASLPSDLSKRDVVRNNLKALAEEAFRMERSAVIAGHGIDGMLWQKHSRRRQGSEERKRNETPSKSAVDGNYRSQISSISTSRSDTYFEIQTDHLSRHSRDSDGCTVGEHVEMASETKSNFSIEASSGESPLVVPTARKHNSTALVCQSMIRHSQHIRVPTTRILPLRKSRKARKSYSYKKRLIKSEVRGRTTTPEYSSQRFQEAKMDLIHSTKNATSYPTGTLLVRPEEVLEHSGRTHKRASIPPTDSCFSEERVHCDESENNVRPFVLNVDPPRGSDLTPSSYHVYNKEHICPTDAEFDSDGSRDWQSDFNESRYMSTAYTLGRQFELSDQLKISKNIVFQDTKYSTIDTVETFENRRKRGGLDDKHDIGEMLEKCNMYQSNSISIESELIQTPGEGYEVESADFDVDVFIESMTKKYSEMKSPRTKVITQDSSYVRKHTSSHADNLQSSDLDYANSDIDSFIESINKKYSVMELQDELNYNPIPFPHKKSSNRISIPRDYGNSRKPSLQERALDEDDILLHGPWHHGNEHKPKTGDIMFERNTQSFKTAVSRSSKIRRAVRREHCCGAPEGTIKMQSHILFADARRVKVFS